MNPAYLEGRAKLIDRNKTMGTAKPGEFPTATPGVTTTPEHGTSHIPVADKYGNVASMTTTVESAFGSFHMVDGFLLNNQLTDFSAEPVDSAGQPVANRVQPGKRPRSSMSPTILFGRGADGARGEAIGGEEAERLEAQARGGGAGITSAEISSSEDDFPASGPKNSRSPQM